MYSLFVYCALISVLCVSSWQVVVSQSTDPFDFIRDRECNYTTRCEGLFGFSDCKNRKCECRNGFYFASQFERKPFCQICPNFGERCDEANCCRHPEYVACSDGFCRCKDSSMYSCVHFEPNTQLMIAAKLALFGIILVSLAILLMVLRRSCGGEDCDVPRSTYRRDRIYASLNSIQRFVMAKMQDRPPPYDELEESSTKEPPPYSVALSTQDYYGYEAPPPYSLSLPAYMPSTSGEGISNPIFITDSTMDLSHGFSDQSPPVFLPITLSTSASAPPSRSRHPQEEAEVASETLNDTEAINLKMSDLTRPVLTEETVRRMSNYSTFSIAPEIAVLMPIEDPTPSTSGLTFEDLHVESQILETRTSRETQAEKRSSTAFLLENVIGSKSCPSREINPVVSSMSRIADPGSTTCRSRETVPADSTSNRISDFESTFCSSEKAFPVEVRVTSSRISGSPEQEAHTTDLPPLLVDSADDWLASTLCSVMRNPEVRPDSCLEKGLNSSDGSKLVSSIGSSPTFFISKRPSSTHSSVSDLSEPDSMSFARDYYNYDREDDACSLVSHLHPPAQMTPPPEQAKTRSRTKDTARIDKI